MNGNLKCSQYLLHAHIILSIWWSTCDLLLVNVNSKLLFKENFVVRLVLYIASMKQQKENVFLWLKCVKTHISKTQRDIDTTDKTHRGLVSEAFRLWFPREPGYKSHWQFTYEAQTFLLSCHEWNSNLHQIHFLRKTKRYLYDCLTMSDK